MGFNRVTGIVLLLAVLVAAAGCTGLQAGPQQQAPTYKLGFMGPLTGNSQWYGDHQLKAIQIAADEINAAGGIDGKKLEIVAEDDGCLPKNGPGVLEKLVDTDGVKVIVGPYCSPVCMSAAPLAEAKKVVLFNTCATDKLREAGEYIFRNKPGSAAEAGAVAEFAARHDGVKQVAILHFNNDYGVALRDAFKQAFEAAGGKVTGAEAFDPGSTEYRTQLSKLAAANPEAIYLVGYAKEDGWALRQAREMGLKQRFYGSLPVENADFLTNAGEAAEGIVYPSLYDAHADNPLTKSFNEKFRARYGEDSEMWGALYYDSVMMLKPALEKCGEDAACVKDELLKTKGFEGAAGTTSMDGKGDAVKPFLFKTVKGGKFTALAN